MVQHGARINIANKVLRHGNSDKQGGTFPINCAVLLTTAHNCLASGSERFFLFVLLTLVSAGLLLRCCLLLIISQHHSQFCLLLLPEVKKKVAGIKKIRGKKFSFLL